MYVLRFPYKRGDGWETIEFENKIFRRLNKSSVRGFEPQKRERVVGVALVVCHHDKCNSNRQLHLPSDCTNLCCDCTLPPDATTSRQFVTSANEPAACRLFDRLRLITPFMDTHTCSRMFNPRVYVRLCPNCYLPFLCNPPSPLPYTLPSLSLSPRFTRIILDMWKVFTEL